MADKRNPIILFISILLISFLFLSGCDVGYVQNKNSVIPASEMKKIVDEGKITVTGDSADMAIYYPKSEKAVLTNVSHWLESAKPYKGQIPKSQNAGTFNGYIGPSILYISTPDKHVITISPACYLASGPYYGKIESYVVKYKNNILLLNNNGQTGYIESSQLYDWLKNDIYITEFKLK